jgi:hypothetical protein
VVTGDGQPCPVRGKAQVFAAADALQRLSHSIGHARFERRDQRLRVMDFEPVVREAFAEGTQGAEAGPHVQRVPPRRRIPS